MTAKAVTMVYSYDISGPKVRRRVAELLEKHAVRVQQSVFEARMTNKAATDLFRRACVLLEEGDSLRMYALSAGEAVTPLERPRALARLRAC